MIVKAPRLQPSGAAETKSRSDRLRVLIADDHEFVLQRVVAVLHPHFEIAGTATDGKALIDEALRLKPDIIVSDILMPGMNGLEAANLLRENGCGAKIVFMSVYETGDFVEACLSAGGSGFVTKARMGADLVLAINEVVRGRQFISPS